MAYAIVTNHSDWDCEMCGVVALVDNFAQFERYIRRRHFDAEIEMLERPTQSHLQELFEENNLSFFCEGKILWIAEIDPNPDEIGTFYFMVDVN